MREEIRRRPRRALLVVAVVLLALLALSGVPEALRGALPTFTPTPTPSASAEPQVQGRLTSLETDENRGLSRCTPGAAALADCGPAPAVRDTGTWLNTPGGRAVSLDDLRGKVVLLDVFAYTCINCRRDLVRVERWYDAYRDAGLEVVGVHAPELDVERSAANLRRVVDRVGIPWPVVQDDRLATRTAYRASVWPAKYLVDARGTVRAVRLGEGGYRTMERQLRELLREADPQVRLPNRLVDPGGPAATPGRTAQVSLGWASPARSTYDGEPAVDPDDRTDYALAVDQREGTYSLGGAWTVGSSSAEPADGSVARLGFRASDVHQVVAGRGSITVEVDGEPARTVRIEGTPDVRELWSGSPARARTMTLIYRGDLRVYTFSFG